jgi:hypothetical protein
MKKLWPGYSILLASALIFLRRHNVVLGQNNVRRELRGAPNDPMANIRIEQIQEGFVTQVLFHGTNSN